MYALLRVLRFFVKQSRDYEKQILIALNRADQMQCVFVWISSFQKRTHINTGKQAKYQNVRVHIYTYI